MTTVVPDGAADGGRAAADLAEALRRGPFHAALRAAIRARDLPLDRLRYRLAQHGVQVSLSTLSSWQHGKAQPERASSIAGVRILEHELGLPEGSLIALLGAPRPRGPRASTRRLPARPEGPLGLGPALTTVLQSLEGADAYTFDVVSRSDTVRLDGEGRLRSVLIRTMVSAVRDGADSYYSTFAGERGTDPGQVQVTALSGCTIGEIRPVPGAPALVTRLVLDDVLAEGECSMLEFRYDPESGDRTPFYGYCAYRPTGQYQLHVQFEPSLVPVRCQRFRHSADMNRASSGEPVPISRSGRAHMYAQNLVGQAAGLRWEWA